MLEPKLLATPTVDQTTARSNPPNRQSVATRIVVRAPLSTTGPTLDDVEFLKRFAFRPFDYAYHGVDLVARTRSAWRSLEYMAHRPIGDDELLEHLRQKRALAAYCAVDHSTDGSRRCLTPWIAIDLDYHGDDADLVGRMQAVCAALGRPTFVLATPSGGAHAYYLLDEWTHIYELHAPDSQFGIVSRLLDAAGVRVERGNAEVYPAPRSVTRPSNVVRLPFGVGSWLLDPWDLSIHDAHVEGVEALRWVRNGFSLGELSMACVAEWRAAAVAVPPRKSKSHAMVGSRSAAAEADRHLIPFRDGLPASGTRDTAIAAWAFWCRSRGMSLEQAIDHTGQWLTRNHNGKSATIRRHGLEHALCLAADTVRRIYTRNNDGRVAPRVEMPALTKIEAQRIIELVMDPTRCCDPNNGEALNPYWAAHHAFRLMRCAAQEAFSQVRDQQVLRRRDGTMRLTGRAWPNCADDAFMVPIPYTLRSKRVPDPVTGRAARTAPAHQESAIFRFLTEGQAPLLHKLHGHCSQQGMCAWFAVHLDLHGSRCVSDVATAFRLFGGGQERVRSRLRPPGWKRVSNEFDGAPVADRDDVASPEVCKARDLHEEALALRATDGHSIAAAKVGADKPVSHARISARPTDWDASANRSAA